jgi:hypothetical protein
MQPSVREDIMHPMFVKLFMETDDDDLLYEQGRRRRAPVPASPAGHGRKARRPRPAVVTATARPEGTQP